MAERACSLSGPVHFTLIDGLDGSLVPATGTPVPGGLSFWQVLETIETLFANPSVVLSAQTERNRGPRRRCVDAVYGRYAGHQNHRQSCSRAPGRPLDSEREINRFPVQYNVFQRLQK